MVEIHEKIEGKKRLEEKVHGHDKHAKQKLRIFDIDYFFR